jgi:hypothetical protein
MHRSSTYNHAHDITTDARADLLRARRAPGRAAAWVRDHPASRRAEGRSNVIAELSSPSFDIAVLTHQIPVVLSLVALVVLTWRTGRPPLSWLGLPALPMTLLLARLTRPKATIR